MSAASPSMRSPALASPPVRLPARGESTGGWLVDQLPMCFAADDFLRRFVGLFQELADGLRQRIDGIEHVVDATIAPPAFVRWMGGWLGVRGIDPSLPVEHQRRLVFGFGELLMHRGTRAGLQQAVELVTRQRAVVGDPGTIVREGDPLPSSVSARIEIPAMGGVSLPDLVAVIRDWLPVAASAELWVGGRCVWDGAERGRR